MNFKDTLNEYIDWARKHSPALDCVTLAITEGHVRRVLKIKPKAPLVHRGFTLKCIGSRQWRIKRSRMKYFQERIDRGEALLQRRRARGLGKVTSPGAALESSARMPRTLKGERR